MIIWKSIIFYEIGKLADGHFFHNSDHDSPGGKYKIHGVKDLTLPKAIEIMKQNGIDPVANFKMNILSYC